MGAVLIVNPVTHKECIDGEVVIASLRKVELILFQIGEIWVCGESKTLVAVEVWLLLYKYNQGYWQKEQATNETFSRFTFSSLFIVAFRRFFT
jgi:hypothetical protein